MRTAGVAGRELAEDLVAGQVPDVAPHELDLRDAAARAAGSCRVRTVMCAPKVEAVIGEREALENPAPEKPGAAGDEDILAAQRLPQAARVGENVLEVGCGERRALAKSPCKNSFDHGLR